MMVIRPIRLDDTEQLLTLALEAGVGMTSLPPDSEVLCEKVDDSLRGFSGTANSPADESYLFVLEDLNTQQIVGTCGIVVSVGNTKPFYSYKLSTLTHSSEQLNVHKEIKALYLVNDYQGVSEICTLFLTPAYRQHHNGSLLSRSRFLFMAEFPHRFAKTVIAELRGVQNHEGRSPFWRNLGRHFFDMDFSEADYLTTTGNKQFISDLMPRYPIYVPLLPPEAQAVIGCVHDATKPAMKMLEREGFEFEGYVDIFDAGPTVQAHRDHIHTVQKSKRKAIEGILPELEGPLFLISNISPEFRACLGTCVETEEGGVHLTKSVAHALQVKEGDRVRFVSLKDQT